jgi:hypothetical protein
MAAPSRRERQGFQAFSAVVPGRSKSGANILGRTALNVGDPKCALVGATVPKRGEPKSPSLPN